MPQYIWMPLYIGMPPVCFDGPHMFGTTPTHVWIPCVWFGWCLDACCTYTAQKTILCQTKGMSICPPYIWCPHAWNPPVCLDAPYGWMPPCLFGHPLWLDAPKCLDNPSFWTQPLPCQGKWLSRHWAMTHKKLSLIIVINYLKLILKSMHPINSMFCFIFVLILICFISISFPVHIHLFSLCVLLLQTHFHLVSFYVLLLLIPFDLVSFCVLLLLIFPPCSQSNGCHLIWSILSILLIWLQPSDSLQVLSHWCLLFNLVGILNLTILSITDSHLVPWASCQSDSGLLTHHRPWATGGTRFTLTGTLNQPKWVSSTQLSSTNSVLQYI